MGWLTSGRLAVLLAICLAALFEVAYWFAFSRGAELEALRNQSQRVEILQDELKKNVQAKAIADAVAHDDDSAVNDWMQSNGFFRED